MLNLYTNTLNAIEGYVIVNNNGIGAIQIKQASRCLHNTFILHKVTQSSHNGVRGL